MREGRGAGTAIGGPPSPSKSHGAQRQRTAAFFRRLAEDVGSSGAAIVSVRFPGAGDASVAACAGGGGVLCSAPMVQIFRSRQFIYEIIKYITLRFE